MAAFFLRTARLSLAVSIGLNFGSIYLQGQQAASAPITGTQTAPQDTSATSSKTARPAQTWAQRRAQRRARRLAAQQSAVAPAPQPSTISSAAQRERDQRILDQQKAQSIETARENDAVTRKQVSDQQRVQAEPRIQDAPGPGVQPPAGDPAVQPAQQTDPPRIQDAPGPAQTTPKAPPTTPAPQS